MLAYAIAQATGEDSSRVEKLHQENKPALFILRAANKS
jgi:hypothetical protein